jgi:hypothetical protein
VAVAVILFIAAMALTYVHRTYKMSRPAREAVQVARLVRSPKAAPEKRQTPPRRPMAVPRLPLEGLSSAKTSDAGKAERHGSS